MPKSFETFYGQLTPEQVIQRQRDKVRARLSKQHATAHPGGEGVRPQPAPSESVSFTSAEKISAKGPAQEQGQAFAQAPVQVPVLGWSELHDPLKFESSSSAGQLESTHGEAVCPPLELAVPALGGAGKVEVPWEGADDESPLDRIHDLIAILDGNLVTQSQAASVAWNELVRDYGPVKEPEVVPLPVKIIGADDPPTVQKARVIRKLPGEKWVVRPYKLSKAPEGVLYLKRSREFVKLDWVVWVRPNPYEDQGGYVLHGVYNRYGDRLE